VCVCERERESARARPREQEKGREQEKEREGERKKELVHGQAYTALSDVLTSTGCMYIYVCVFMCP